MEFNPSLDWRRAKKLLGKIRPEGEAPLKIRLWVPFEENAPEAWLKHYFLPKAREEFPEVELADEGVNIWCVVDSDKSSAKKLDECVAKATEEFTAAREDENSREELRQENTKGRDDRIRKFLEDLRSVEWRG